MATQSNQQDTSRDAERVLIALVRKQAPTERLRTALSATRRVAEQCKRAIARANPGISEDEIRLRFIELNYGKALADNVRQQLTAGRRL